jgi:hypothetical protein
LAQAYTCLIVEASPCGAKKVNNSAARHLPLSRERSSTALERRSGSGGIHNVPRWRCHHDEATGVELSGAFGAP